MRRVAVTDAMSSPQSPGIDCSGDMHALSLHEHLCEYTKDMYFAARRTVNVTFVIFSVL